MTKLNIDCLYLIFDQMDINSLHSCLLVNKEWCNIAVTILWKKYSNEIIISEKLFNIILSCLPSSSKQLLSDNDIKLPPTILSKTPLFNYISFCEFQSTSIVYEIIYMVLFEAEFINTGNLNVNINLLEQEIYKLYVSQCKNIKYLHWQTSKPLPLFPGATTCFSQLHRLYIDVNVVNSNALYEMAQICKNLNLLSICNCSQDLPGLISLINAQRNLKTVAIKPTTKKFIKKNCEELGKALARKGNTIIHLDLGSVSIIPLSFLTSFINLKNLTITNDEDYADDSEEIKYFQQYLEILEFPVLEYLRVDGLSYIKELAMIIEKSNGNILGVEIYPYHTENIGTFIKSIAKNCPKIERLSIPIPLETKDFIHVELLLLNCRQLKCINVARTSNTLPWILPLLRTFSSC